MIRARPATLLRLALAGGLTALAAAGVAHAWLGLDLLEHQHLFPQCPFHALTGLDCPGCGMTRAFLLLSQLRPLDALAAHPASLPLLAAVLWRVARPRARIPRRDALASVALASVLGIWAVRAL